MLVWLFVIIVIWIVWWDQTRPRIKREMVNIDMRSICKGCESNKIEVPVYYGPPKTKPISGADERFASALMNMQRRDRQALTKRLHWSADQFKPYVEAELQDHEQRVWWETDQSELN